MLTSEIVSVNEFFFILGPFYPQTRTGCDAVTLPICACTGPLPFAPVPSTCSPPYVPAKCDMFGGPSSGNRLEYTW